MTPSAALDTQVQEEQERHDLLEKLKAENVSVDPEMSLTGLQELYATFGPGAKNENAQIGAVAREEDDAPPADPEGKALFDKDAYIPEALALPMVDGEGYDKIGVKFGGAFLLERGDEKDVALVRDKKLGQKVTLLVEATALPPVPAMTTSKDGELDVLVFYRPFKITGVYKPIPEQLSDLVGSE